jgi:hypothetical protein
MTGGHEVRGSIPLGSIKENQRLRGIASRPFLLNCARFVLVQSKNVYNSTIALGFLPDAGAEGGGARDQRAAAPGGLRAHQAWEGLPIYEKMLASEDYREGPRAFAEKRKSVCKGR